MDTSHDICASIKRDFQFFYFLTEEDARQVSEYFQCRQLVKGEPLWKEGEEEEYVAFIVSGRVEARKETKFGGKQVVVGVYGKGSIVGELCILNSHKRAVSAIAMEDADLLILSRLGMDAVTEEHPELGVKLLKGILYAVSLRLRKSFDRIAEIF